MRTSFITFLAVALVLAVAPSARADYSFQFTDGSGNTVANNAFSVNQGQTVTIQVYLLETNGQTALQTSGLINGGVRLTYNSNIANVTGLTGNSAFSSTTTSIGTAVGTGSTSYVLNGTLGTAVTAPSTGANADRILLGTFTFTGVGGGNSLVLSATPNGGSSSDNVLGDSSNTVIDSLISTPNASITVAVPEPGSMVLGGLAVAGMVLGAARRLSLRAV